MLPKTLKKFTCFVDGYGQVGKDGKLTPPKLTMKGEEHRSGGMDMPVTVDMGMDALEFVMEFAEYDPKILEIFGQAERDNRPVVFRGAQESATGETEAIIHTMRGGITQHDMGDWDPGSKSMLKCTGKPRYYKLEIAGRRIYEIDAENMVRFIGDTDQLAEQRRALGL